MKNLKKNCLLLIPVLLLTLTCSCEKAAPEEEILTQTFDYPGGTIKMIYCPGGTYLSNNDDSDLDFEDGPGVTVDPFWISETEVTNELLAWIYNSAAGSLAGTMVLNPFFFNSEDNDAHNYLCEDYVKWGGQDLIYMGESFLGGDYDIFLNPGFDVRSTRNDYPVDIITWYGAVMACNWLTYEGLGLGTTVTVYSGIDEEWWDDETVCNFNRTGFRLPTTAEWECAARWQGSNSSGECYEYPAGSGQYWTRGGCASGASATTDNVKATAAVAVYEYDSDGYTNPDDKDKVKGNRQPNKLGLYDMSGNVWEWCFDDAGRYMRVIRGGGVGSNHHDVMIISTSDYPADGTASALGFRLVMSADD